MYKYSKLITAAITLGLLILLTSCGDVPNIVHPVNITEETKKEPEPQPSQSQPNESSESEFSAAESNPEQNNTATDTSQQFDESQPKLDVSQTSASQQVPDASQSSDTPDAPQLSDLPEEISITITAAGDVTLGNHMEQGYEATFRQTYDNAEDKSYFFENVADIFRQDDMTIVNLEGALTLSENFAEGRTYNIKGDPEYAWLLTDASIEAVSMGNNHRLDYGEEGSRDTVAALQEAGVAYAYDTYTGTYETQGIKIGWVSVNEASQGKNVEKILQNGIASLKEEGAQLILAACHWGTEREYYPEDYQKELGRKCIDWGADLVIGHHPHVLQGIDQYQGKYIIYSLGNFCFGANRNPADKDTMIFQQTFTFRRAEQGETAQEGTEASDAKIVENAQEGTEAANAETAENVLTWESAQPGEARIIPCRISSVTTRNDFKPTPLTGEEGQRVIDRINEFSLEYGVKADEQGILSWTGVDGAAEAKAAETE